MPHGVVRGATCYFRAQELLPTHLPSAPGDTLAHSHAHTYTGPGPGLTWCRNKQQLEQDGAAHSNRQQRARLQAEPHGCKMPLATPHEVSSKLMVRSTHACKSKHARGLYCLLSTAAQRNGCAACATWRQRENFWRGPPRIEKVFRVAPPSAGLPFEPQFWQACHGRRESLVAKCGGCWPAWW